MKEILRLVSTLTIICIVAGFLLAWVNGLTAGPIQAAKDGEKNAAIRQVLPEHDNTPGQSVVQVADRGERWTFYVARKGGAFAGAAFEAVSGKGYAGKIRIMAGVNPAGVIHAIRVLEQKETPGLGAKINDPSFRDQFAGKGAATQWKVRKDGGDIQEITAATISSRAVTEAVAAGLTVFLAHRAELEAGGVQP